ncbi:MAG: hypothetical protein A3F70_10925 [Acidobacteria bacterium RIFCSPLOWO2_12_FULL_67_14]|nr:MAG: hypothetical protein A3H29_05535 [Acidobacteria bacterium RIFCSPLOWO2_02_FULL_67_21]OFW39336.1 MAG: hypothetical protein A3F70_10925 [Acidobacteria bacterium RIFCSPLOWO2_12_FULL_67_14]
MLEWFRFQAPWVAVALILATGVVGRSAVLPHEDDCHDAACNPVAVEHNAAAHRIGADSSGPDGHPQHCLVCHWARAFRPRAEARIVSAPASSADVRIPAVPFTLSAAAPVSQPPLRSPPL